MNLRLHINYSHRRNCTLVFLFVLTLSCASRELIDPEKSDSYFTTAGNIIYIRQGNILAHGSGKKCEADINSFEILSRDIAKDKESIYYRGEKQPQVDYESFYMDGRVPKDKKKAYIGGKTSLEEIPGVDAATFTFIEDVSTINKNTWSKDKNHYYRKFKRLDVHYSSFEFLNESFSQDKDSLYGWVNNLDPNRPNLCSFKGIKGNDGDVQILNSRYMIVNNDLFYISFLEKNTLKRTAVSSKNIIDILGEHILRIDDLIVVRGSTFKYGEVDANSFELLSPNYLMKYAKDKNHVYFDQEVVEQANPKVFKIFDKSFFAKDDKHVFYKKNRIKADPKTFKKKGNFWADNLGNSYNYKGIKQQ